MTLCSFPFDAMELQILDEMAKENPTAMSMLELYFKMMNIVVTIVWVIILRHPQPQCSWMQGHVRWR
jgi:hypothetical protein